MGTKNQPGEFDCYHNALPDEPMFILLARDISSPELVRAWALNRHKQIISGQKPISDQSMVDEAYKCADNMVEWRRKNR